ncbi:DUF4349 domain-containing protein [Bacillus sp. Marseille-P3661]|uniref:DUF4349 domain-containing protein n=1 Tax=Bacillus sp. Marseille-P3661 TaxID=1936234 RepID=UPI000C81A4A7|nr:DUF4349 domain-containing protein [Bacillus sp. Marseille-P3661]
MRRTLFIVIILVPLLLVACGNAGSESSSENSSIVRDGQAGVASSEEVAIESTDNKLAEDVHLDNRLVAYKAEFAVEVQGLKDKIKIIQEEITNKGGFTVESYIYDVGEGRQNARIVAKVPQPEFENFLSFIESESERVNERNIHGEDVTEEYVDLDSRLKAKRVVEERLLTFISNAKTTKELLEISSELGTVQEQIEQIEGKLKYLQNRTNFSLVTINLYDAEIIVPALAKDHLNTWERAQKSFVETINILREVSAGIIIFLVGFSPIWLIGILLLSIIWLVLKRKKAIKRNNTSGQE